jgi:hypothetical protein
MSHLRKRADEEDYYCLVQCDCGRKYNPEDMFLCYFCSKIKCNSCLITEAGVFRCKGFCADDLPSSKKNCTTCQKCLECPLCFTPLITKLFKGKYYLYCTSCYWNSYSVHISKEKKEEFDNYISYIYQEKNAGLFRGMYDKILNQLSKEKTFSGEKEKEAIGEEIFKQMNGYDIVQKAMERGEQNFEEFDKKIKDEIKEYEKAFGEKYEYNDNYLKDEENKENKNKNFKFKNKLLPCYNDFNQTLNSLDEVKKAFNSNTLSVNVMTSLEQRHNNVVFQNNCIWNQYPKFIDLIPKQKDFCKKCKECGNSIIKISDNPSNNDGITHSYISLLPIIKINKIDWENHLIKLFFVLANFVNITISFKEDPLNMTKIKLPEGNFKVENQTGDKKRIIIDFKFDEEHKDDFIKNHMYIFRFILKAEFKRSDVGDSSFIEYPVEIKFK